MANETALEIYTDSASVVGSTLQEALRVSLKDGNVQAGLAAKFPGEAGRYR